MTKIQSIKSSVPIHYLEASTLAALISAKHLSSREVVRAYLDRTEAVNPKINAVVTLMGEAALKAADAADKAVASGAEIGPLHGVPFSIKDALDTAGVLTQRGSKLFARNIPDKDATAVARFKAAGGIPLMKTNVPEFSAWTETDNLVTGRTNNPWNLERTPGGSSGGESAAIAAGMSPIGIGSDVMISVRSSFASFFRKYDVLLCPVNPMTATPHGALELKVNGAIVPWTHVMSPTCPFNLTGLPALSVPYAFSSEQLPINIQLVSKWLDEATILRLGALLERKGGMGERHPSI